MSTTTDRIPVALVGCGTLGELIAEDIGSGNAGPYRLAAVLDEPAPHRAHHIAERQGAVACENLREMLGQKPGIVIEAANGDVLKQIALPCLQRGISLVILSAGALCDNEFVRTIRAQGANSGARMYVASGAIGGFDVARAAMQVGRLQVTVLNDKPPSALEGAPMLGGKTLPPEAVVEVYKGPTREAMRLFPQNVNVVAAMSFATTGVDDVITTVTSNPALINNCHTVVLEGDFGRARIEIESAPCPNNPKSSMIAAYSVTALLKKMNDPIQL